MNRSVIGQAIACTSPKHAIDDVVWVYADDTAICAKIVEVRLMIVLGEFVWCYKLACSDTAWFPEGEVFINTSYLANHLLYINNKPVIY